VSGRGSGLAAGPMVNHSPRRAGRVTLGLVVAVLAFVIIDAGLWALSAEVSSAARPAFVGAASAWGVAVVGIAGTYYGASRAFRFGVEAAYIAERRAAYARLLSFVDDYRYAVDEFHNKEAQLEDIKNNFDPAEEPYKEAKIRLDQASSKVNELLDSYGEAAAVVELLASGDVLRAMKKLKNALGGKDDIAIVNARKDFLNATREELALPPVHE
jgi:hypothetical protein